MIEGYIGRPGSGKTYTLTARVLEEANKGRQIYSNYPIKHPNVEMITIEDLVDPDMPPGLVVIDEVHLWMPARLAMKLPASLLMKFSQTRKMSWDLWWSAQHETRVDRVVRDVTNWMHLARAWKSYNPLAWGPDAPPAYFTATCWEPEKFRKQKQQASRSFRRFSMAVAEAYDTLGTIQVAHHVAIQADAYVNPKPLRAVR